MIRAGRLRHKVLIERNTPSVDAVGGETPSWATIAAFRAEITALTGAERFEAAQIHPDATLRVTTRFISAIAEATAPTLDRLSWNSISYNILSVVDPDCRRERMEILCSAMAEKAAA